MNNGSAALCQEYRTKKATPHPPDVTRSRDTFGVRLDVSFYPFYRFSLLEHKLFQFKREIVLLFFLRRHFSNPTRTLSHRRTIFITACVRWSSHRHGPVAVAIGKLFPSSFHYLPGVSSARSTHRKWLSASYRKHATTAPLANGENWIFIIVKMTHE